MSSVEGAAVEEELASLLNKKPKVPQIRGDCFVNIESKYEWWPEKKKFPNKETAVKYVRAKLAVQVSPTGISTCRSCGSRIAKGDVRLGYPISDPRGAHGVLTAWLHVSCSRLVVSTVAENAGNPPVPATASEEEKSQARDKAEIFLMKHVAFENLLQNEAREEVIDFLAVQPQAGAGANEELLDELVRKKEPQARLPTPKGCAVPLLPFQEEGLAWMVAQEKGVYRGGILADEMGMGKTIQTVALLLHRKSELAESFTGGALPSKLTDDGAANNVATPAAAAVSEDESAPRRPVAGKRSTLVVAPLAAVMQWKSEIERFCVDGSLTVLLYHGSCRESVLQEVGNYDVVITTYAVLESDYRRVLNTYKEACRYCGRLFLSDKLKLHLRYFCGPHARRTGEQAKRQVKRKSAAEKAMVTLDITKGGDELNRGGIDGKRGDEEMFPTIANVYRSIMKEANREDEVAATVSWFTRPEKRIHPTEYQLSTDVGDEAGDEVDVPVSKRKKLMMTGPEWRAQLGIAKTNIAKMKVDELRKLCRTIGLANFGTKVEIVNRLTLFLYPGEPSSVSTDLAELSQTPQQATTADDNLSESSDDDSDRKIISIGGSHEPSPLKPCSRKMSGKPVQGKAAHLASPQPVFSKKASKPVEPNKNMKKERLDKPFAPKVKESNSGCSMAVKQEVKSERNMNMKPEIISLDSSASSSSQSSSEMSVRLRRTTRMRSQRVSLGESDSSSLKGDRDASSSSSYVGRGVGHDDDDDEDSEIWSSDDESDSPIMSPPTKKKTGATKRLSSTKPVAANSVKATVTCKGELKKKTGVSNSNSKKGCTVQSSSMPPDSVTNEDGTGEFSSDREDEVDLDMSPLHSIVWQRIVLDEAHRIKSRTSSTAKSVHALRATEAKWCLSGTPLQNRVGELYSLVRFIRMDPYAYYFCSTAGCNCRSLHYRFIDNRQCVRCGHSRMKHFSYFNRTVVTPIQKYGYIGEGGVALRRLKHEILDKILLRRTKVERAEDVKLPPLEILIKKEKLQPAERDFYDSLYKQTVTQFDTYVYAGTLLHNYAHIFDLLSRLRQACDHPYLIIYGNLAPASMQIADSDDTTNALPSLTEEAVIPAPARANIGTCSICLDDIEDTTDEVLSGCRHTFHRSCVLEYLESAPTGDGKQQLGCPACFAPLSVDLANRSPPTSPHAQPPAQRGILSRVRANEFQSSSKLESLVEELERIEATDPAAKSIVFSQYTAMLELCEWRLRKGGIPCAKLTGALSIQARANILLTFNTDPQLKVVLMSLKAGGEGLNLQIANNVFLLDPWWNPAAELQAIQRAHRIGQKKPVRAVRFVCESTIEEKILQLQEKKQLVFEGTVGSSNAALAKLTERDLKFLFHS